MSKKILSTFEREMQDIEFRTSSEKEYKEFVLAEVLANLMKESHKTIRGLAEEIGISPTIIQRVKSGQQKDLKITNFLNIVEACGYHIYLEKGDRRIEI
ncbi:helix-turn-helix domain-containing protein [Candidatus Paracaedibacter symbiosus]|uniref:helix-turn-helix domain-containing protein n=1 Tax=Candidatus Paracaedibacter symbiosus TaxID=244582 RepID=UPI000509C488|nr:helix-turn-helix domain-containing protein [Candidatus Paracaedibacter symbiosus]